MDAIPIRVIHKPKQTLNCALPFTSLDRLRHRIVSRERLLARTKAPEALRYKRYDRVLSFSNSPTHGLGPVPEPQTEM